MAADRPELRPFPEDLRFQGAVPSEAIFFDTNAVRQRVVEMAVQNGRTALISSLVYAELGCKAKQISNDTLNALDTALRDRGIRIVDFDGEAARCFLAICRRLHFDQPPLLRPPPDNRHACFERLRFDITILALAVRHRRLLITDNTNDFEHFPFRRYGATTVALNHDPALQVPSI
jgi:predicted nucleic acid-binding protein